MAMDSEFPQGTVELWCQEQHEEGLLKGNSTIQQAHPQDNGDQAFPGQGKLAPIEEELRRLRAENKRLLMERDILKKAAAFFAREAT